MNVQTVKVVFLGPYFPGFAVDFDDRPHSLLILY